MQLFDTNFLVDLVNGDRGAVKKATQVDREGTFSAVSVVTVHEYLRGIFHLYSKDEKLLQEKLGRAEAELARFETLPYTYEVARVAAEVDARAHEKGISSKLCGYDNRSYRSPSQAFHRNEERRSLLEGN